MARIRSDKHKHQRSKYEDTGFETSYALSLLAVLKWYTTDSTEIDTFFASVRNFSAQIDSIHYSRSAKTRPQHPVPAVDDQCHPIDVARRIRA